MLLTINLPHLKFSNIINNDFNNGISVSYDYNTVYISRDNVHLWLTGQVYNIQQLCGTYLKMNSIYTTIIDLYLKYRIEQLTRLLDGQYSIILFDNREETLNGKQLYYINGMYGIYPSFKSNENKLPFIIGTNKKKIKKILNLKEERIKKLKFSNTNNYYLFKFNDDKKWKFVNCFDYNSITFSFTIKINDMNNYVKNCMDDLFMHVSNAIEKRINFVKNDNISCIYDGTPFSLILIKLLYLFEIKINIFCFEKNLYDEINDIYNKFNLNVDENINLKNDSSFKIEYVILSEELILNIKNEIKLTINDLKEKDNNKFDLLVPRYYLNKFKNITLFDHWGLNKLEGTNVDVIYQSHIENDISILSEINDYDILFELNNIYPFLDRTVVQYYFTIPSAIRNNYKKMFNTSETNSVEI